MMDRCEEELGCHGSERITDSLRTGSGRLEELLREAVDHVGYGSILQARDQFDQFGYYLAHHIAVEESTVLPAFLERTGRVGRVKRICREHRKMATLRNQAQRALDEQDGAGFVDAAARLRILLRAHLGRS